MVKVQPLRKGSVLDCLMHGNEHVVGGLDVIYKGNIPQTEMDNRVKLLLLQVNSLARKKPKKARVRAAHSIIWSALQLRGGWK